MSAQLSKPKSGYLPSLDGWRAIAILGVLIAHDNPWIIAGHSTAVYKGIGGNGVHLFFAISGFLITTRILEEESICGRFNIKGFYIRRILRIQPVAWLYLGVIAILALIGIVRFSWSQWVSALLLYENFKFHFSVPASEIFFLGHFWTLSVEEHFYILLSATLLFFKKRRIAVLGGLYLLSRAVLSFGMAYGYYNDYTERQTWWQLHFLLLAAFAAAVMREPAARRAAERYLKPWLVFALSIVIPAAHLIQVHLRHGNSPHSGFLRVYYGYFVTYAFIFWILSTVFNPRSLTTRFLETPVMRFIGRISYSLYLWHILFFNRANPDSTVTNKFLAALSGWPTKFFAAFAVATLSYYFIERPFMRLGHRLAPPATPGRLDLIEPSATSASANG